MRNEKDIENAAIEYADGVFRSYWYYHDQVEAAKEQLDLIEYKLVGVRSPQIKSPEEAKYQNSPTVYKDKHIELIEKKDHILEKIDEAKRSIDAIDLFLDVLSEENRRLMTLYYIDRLSLDTVARKVYMSTPTVWRHIRKCLLMFAD